MRRPTDEQPRQIRRESKTTLTDTDMTTTRIDRRSFFARAVGAASIAAGAALTAACPGGSGDGTDSDSESE